MRTETDEQPTLPETAPERGWVHRYIVVKALEDGVVIMGLTRGRDTRSHHSERLDAGEVLIAQFTTTTAAIKVRGRAQVLTEVGPIESGLEG